MLVRQSMFRRFGINEEGREYSEGDQKKDLDEEKKTKIIASIDSGINVNHPCFSDEKLSVLEGRKLNIPYAKKFVVLKNYTKGIISRKEPCLMDSNFVEDLNGHGTACASIAAGSLTELDFLHGVSGISIPKIQGVNPWARMASYKVLGSPLAIDYGIEVMKYSLLLAIKEAISDKVDAILVALSSDRNLDNHYFLGDPVNLGGYLAMKKNILLCKSAGNQGIRFFTLTGGLAPWVLTVGSCNSGGKFVTNIELGNALTIKGYQSIVNKGGQFCELIDSSQCLAEVGRENQLTRAVEGIIIFCDSKVESPPVYGLLNAGAAGVLCVKKKTFNSYHPQKPIIYVNDEDGLIIASYIVTNRQSGSRAEAKICKSVYEEEDQLRCTVSSNSAKGPNPYDQYILKPDICAPGEEILCASKYDKENMYAHYEVLSGTSMSAAVVVGMVSYIKAIHKDWNPARIKSAIMTTAKLISEPSFAPDLAACGNGCFDPVKAIDPGLVYDVSAEEFRRYLLNHDADKKALLAINENIQGQKLSAMDLNIPNFSLVLDRTETEYIFNRRLTNVGSPQCSYKAEIKLHDRFFTRGGNICSEKFPEFISIDVQPDVLEFDQKEQEKCFKLTVKSSRLLSKGKEPLLQASLIWHEQIESHRRDQPHTVSSRIMIINHHLWGAKPKQKLELVLPQKRSADQGDA